MEAKVRIGRVSSLKGEGHIVIEVEENISGLTVCQLNMSYEEFAECITGMSGCEGKFEFLPTPFTVQNYGKKRVVEQRLCPKVRSFKREDQSMAVEKHFKTHDEPLGWMLWDDGTRTQQNGEDHCYVVWKFVKPDNEVSHTEE